MRKWNEAEMAALKEVASRRAPHLLPLLESGAAPDRQQAEELEEAVVADFCSLGLQPDAEPNELGRLLDDLAWSIRSELLWRQD